MAQVIDTTRLSSRSLTGIALAAFAFAFLTGADTVFKILSTGHPGYQILVVSGLFALLPIFGRAYLAGGLSALSTTRPFAHLLRAIAGVLSTLAAIFAYERLSLTDYYAIVFAGPLLVTALSSFWLKEKVDRQRWILIGIGFTGVLVVANPFQEDVSPHKVNALLGRLSALLSVFCYALSVLMVRRMRVGESSMTFAFFGYSVSIVGGLFAWALCDTPAFSFNEVAHLALSGFLGGMGNLCLMEAYYLAPIALVAPLQYTQIFWGALASYFLWGMVPRSSLILGAAIVIASGLGMLYRELRGTDPPRT